MVKNYVARRSSNKHDQDESSRVIRFHIVSWCIHPASVLALCYYASGHPSRGRLSTHFICTAGRTRRALKLVQGEAAFLIMSLYLPPKHRHASCQCFCWMPTVTFPKLHGQSRPVSTATRKPHSTVSAWENCCGITICRQRTPFFLRGSDFLFGPFSNTQIDFACLPATVHVHEQAYTRCPFRAGPDHLSVTGRGSLPAR